MATKLYVGNLSFSTTEEELRQAFAEFGSVTSCNVIMDRMTDRPRGFAFVEMASPAEAAKAIEALNNKELGGRALVVNEAKPREDRPRGGGGGGYGGGGGGGGYGGGGGGGGGGRRNRY
jgi:RNA recognition motif-containing protein